MLAALKKKTSSLTISSVLSSESSNKYNSKSGKRDNESAICFAFLMQPTGKYCSICHTEYPEFQSGILGPYFYVLFECYYYYYFFSIFIFIFLPMEFFSRYSVSRYSVTRYSLLVTPLLCLVTPCEISVERKTSSPSTSIRTSLQVEPILSVLSPFQRKLRRA